MLRVRIAVVRRLLVALICVPFAAFAAEFNNPLAAIAANPALSETYNLVKKTGYAEPLGTGGDVTFLALSNKLLSQTRHGERFTTLEFIRDKIPPEAQLLMLQALTLDGQYGEAEFEALLKAQGNGKAEVVSVLGPDAKYKVYRGKEPGTYILEDARRNGMLISVANATATENGTLIVVDANATPSK